MRERTRRGTGQRLRGVLRVLSASHLLCLFAPPPFPRLLDRLTLELL
jgi:hypothetical protein